MYKFGQEITPVLSGTTWPVQVAQYDRYIQRGKPKRIGQYLSRRLQIISIKMQKRSPW
jgi:hypothetical protein